MILGSNLGYDYWSDTLIHAVCLKNRLPHQSLRYNITPHEACANEKPDLFHLRVFGSVLHTKKSGIRRGKLYTSLITRSIILGCTPASRNTICHDAMTRETKRSRHFVVKESHFTSKTERPSYSKDLVLNCKDKLINHPKSVDSTLNRHTAEDTAIHR